MPKFTIEPYVGALPIKFGMTPKEVAKIVGPPERAYENWNGTWVEDRKTFNLGYTNKGRKCCHIGFSPQATVIFDGQNLLKQKDVAGFLYQYDSKPMEDVGFLIFFKLGVTVTGYYNNNRSDRAVTVFVKGKHDEFLKEAKPWKPGRTRAKKPSARKPATKSKRVSKTPKKTRPRK